MQQSQQDFMDRLRMEAIAREAAGQPSHPGSLANGVDEDEIFFSRLARYQAATAPTSAPAWWTAGPAPQQPGRINWGAILPIGLGAAALMVGATLAFGANRQDAGLMAGQGAMRLAAEVVRSDRGSYNCISLFGCPSPAAEPVQSSFPQPIQPHQSAPVPPPQSVSAPPPGSRFVVVVDGQSIALEENQALLVDPRTNRTLPVTISNDGRGGVSLSLANPVYQ